MIGFNAYGLFISLAILTAYTLTAERARRRGLRADWVWESLPWIVVGGLIGARLYHVINYFPFYLNRLPLIPQVWLGGLGIFGGLAGGLVGLWVWFKTQSSRLKIATQNLKAPREGNYITIRSVIYSYLDAAAPGIALGQAVGRMGNIINGELLPYAYWELVTDLLIFVWLILIERYTNSKSQITNPKQIPNLKLQTRGGYLFFLYLLCYSMTRFLLEFFRTDSPWIFGPLTVAQWVSLAVLTGSLGWLLTNRGGKGAATTPGSRIRV